MRTPLIGGLFYGYGGLDMAVQQVTGGTLAWYSEIEPGACRIASHHHPGIPNLGDITQIDWQAAPRVDVLTGGFPCQDVSTAGARAGLRDGTRTGLWAHMLQAVDTLRPGLVVAENVRGLLSAEADSDVESCPWCVGDNPDSRMRALGAVLADLDTIGYDAQWVSVRASDVGACHRRERVFITAHPKGQPWRECVGDPRPARLTTPRRLLPTVKATNNENRQGPGYGPNLGEALRLLPTPRTSDTNGAGAHGQGGLDLRTAVTLLPTPTTQPDTGNGHARSLGKEVRLLPTPMTTDGKGIGPADLGRHSPQLRALPKLLPTPRASDGPHGGPNSCGSKGDLALPAAACQDFGEYGEAIARHEQAFGHAAPSPTEPGKKGAPRLAARFAEWMMCLPDGWVTDPTIWEGMTDTAARNAQLHALGNGVVPPQAVAAVTHLIRVGLS